MDDAWFTYGPRTKKSLEGKLLKCKKKRAKTLSVAIAIPLFSSSPTIDLSCRVVSYRPIGRSVGPSVPWMLANWLQNLYSRVSEGGGRWFTFTRMFVLKFCVVFREVLCCLPCRHMYLAIACLRRQRWRRRRLCGGMYHVFDHGDVPGALDPGTMIMAGVCPPFLLQIWCTESCRAVYM